MAQFKTSGLDIRALMPYFSGVPTTPWGKRQARQTRSLLSQAGVPSWAIEAGSFDHIDPQTASMWIMGHEESKTAFGKTEAGFESAMKLLAAELGEDIPEELKEKYGAEGGSVQSRMDRLRGDLYRRSALQRQGIFDTGMSQLKKSASRTGQPVSEKDIAEIRHRAAVGAGRQLGEETGQLRREEESRRMGVIGRMSDMMSERIYEPTDYSALASFPKRRQSIIRRSGGGQKNYGVNLVRNQSGAGAYKRKRRDLASAPGYSSRFGPAVRRMGR